MRTIADFALELQSVRRGFSPVAGVDEAGRGPLAGPVVAAAVIFDPGVIPPGLADSKALSARRREELFDSIVKLASAVSIGVSPASEIDAINIRQATFAAMRRAAAALAVAPGFALIDGKDVPPGLPCPADAIVKGDARSVSIAAASIIAKVTRDHIMTQLGTRYPQYGFGQHAGYPTATHRAMITAHGPSPFHRLSFGQMKRGNS